MKNKLQEKLGAGFLKENYKPRVIFLFNISVTFFLPYFCSPYSVLVTYGDFKFRLSSKVRESVTAFDLQSIQHASECCINNIEV